MRTPVWHSTTDAFARSHGLHAVKGIEIGFHRARCVHVQPLPKGKGETAP